MIKSLFSFFGTEAPSWYRSNTDVKNEINYQLNENIKVSSSFYSCTDYFSDVVTAKTAQHIMSGDTLIMFISSNHTIKTAHPQGFKEILTATCTKKRIAMSVLYKVWNHGDPTTYEVGGDSLDLFVNLITLRGTRFVIDARARINNSCSVDNSIVAPRVTTAKEGALINAFAYDEPQSVHLSTKKVLASIENGHKGLAVGISPTSGGMSSRVKAFANADMCGGGDDIALSIAIR